ncbi:MAG: acyl carrier protein [Pseudomonadota bacterium]
MASQEELVQKLTLVFQDVFDDDDLAIYPEMTAADVDDWDSLKHITLVLAVEKAFQIRLKAAEVGALENVGQMIELLQKRLA